MRVFPDLPQAGALSPSLPRAAHTRTPVLAAHSGLSDPFGLFCARLVRDPGPFAGLGRRVLPPLPSVVPVGDDAGAVGRKPDGRCAKAGKSLATGGPQGRLLIRMDQHIRHVHGQSA